MLRRRLRGLFRTATLRLSWTRGTTFQRGGSVMGTVVQYEYRGALVDIGAKSSAFLPLRECSLMPIDDVSTAVALDELREFQVVSDENDNGQLTVSIRRIEFQKA